MLLSVGIATAALLLSAVQAAVPLAFPRLSRSFNTTTAAQPTSTSAGLPINGNGGVTISGVVTITSASIPTSFQTAGSVAFAGVLPIATNAASSFSAVAAAASSIAAEPSPSVDEISSFRQLALAEFKLLDSLETELREIDRDSLDDDDSHKVSDSIIGLAALLAWYTDRLSDLAPALTDTALAGGIFGDLATAFAAAAAGDLLADALSDLMDDGVDPSNTDKAPGVSSTETATSTATSATASCSALSYRLSLPDEIDGFGGADFKRSIAGRVILEKRGLLVARGKRFPFFGSCSPANKPAFPGNPGPTALEQAEKNPRGGNDCETLAPGFAQIDTAAAKAKELSNFNVDHVWELKFFTDFFESFLPGRSNSHPSLNCDDFNAVFPSCILTTVANQVPGPNNAEFVAMQKDLNNMKGAMFKPGELANKKFTDHFSASTDTKIQALQAIGISVDIFNQAQVVALFDRTNQRMYSTFQGIDNRVQDNSITLSFSNFKFADAYRQFMSDRLAQASQEAWTFVQTWMSSIESDLSDLDPDDEGSQKLQKNFNGFKQSPYASQNHYSFLVNTDLVGAGGTPVQFPKRELWARDGSCPIGQSSGTLTSGQSTSVQSTATTVSTSTPSGKSTSEEASLSTATSRENSTTQKQIHAHTVTSNGMVCVLIDGSTDPHCHLLSTPTPNPAGTNVHVNSGCVTVNGSPRCASDAGHIANVYQSTYNVASDPNQPYSTALILSGFNSSDDNHLHAMATCKLQARWPANYGDIYYGADGCLYDSGSNKILDQCCSTPDINNDGPTTNPYVAPAPPDASQSSGNHDGSAICRSISKDTCLLAASRYIDDTIYHQYTSAVWPDDSGADLANDIFPIAGPVIEQLFGINFGCTVIWTCDNDGAFAQGMTGKQIKDSILNIYNLNGAKGCGSTYLDNSCHITVNGCNNCRDEGRLSTLWNPFAVANGSYADAGDGFPPKH
ncbi:meiotically up-regulated gene family-domain-containing protein [Fusarium solani]|uniref:Meiotically up-regulated gene family-domain-containing protein n=1 Tax=Fusarium solani TaxID=169388 RepID=A0A9P9JU35_FUSSL|nr:meiotically up-regulated gene family-domain-containing protein [Fusarium solani]KAH7237867.1 meiotically up-regulated gene family-domain-containing protein [Fusarium solani]